MIKISCRCKIYGKWHRLPSKSGIHWANSLPSKLTWKHCFPIPSHLCVCNSENYGWIISLQHRRVTHSKACFSCFWRSFSSGGFIRWSSRSYKHSFFSQGCAVRCSAKAAAQPSAPRMAHSTQNCLLRCRRSSGRIWVSNTAEQSGQSTWEHPRQGKSLLLKFQSTCFSLQNGSTN